MHVGAFPVDRMVTSLSCRLHRPYMERRQCRGPQESVTHAMRSHGAGRTCMAARLLLAGQPRQRVTAIGKRGECWAHAIYCCAATAHNRREHTSQMFKGLPAPEAHHKGSPTPPCRTRRAAKTSAPQQHDLGARHVGNPTRSSLLSHIQRLMANTQRTAGFSGARLTAVLQNDMLTWHHTHGGSHRGKSCRTQRAAADGQTGVKEWQVQLEGHLGAAQGALRHAKATCTK